MTEYNEGDLVEAVKTDGQSSTILRGLVETIYVGSTNRPNQILLSQQYEPTISWLEETGWTLTVIEKAAPKNVLPTETGWYLDRYHRAFHFTPSSQLFWWGNSEPVKDASHLIGPFTRLEPVPVTAKKVLDRVRESGEMVVHNSAAIHSLPGYAIDRIAQEFGVSS